MNSDKVASIAERVAKSVTAGSALEYLLTEHDMLKLEDHVDEQTWTLAIEVYQKLKKDLELSSNQNEAINRLKRCTEQTSMPQSGLRNEIFKAAHALGIPLPSHFF